MAWHLVASRVESQVSQAQLGMELYRFGRSCGKKMGQRSAPARVGTVLGQTCHALELDLVSFCLSFCFHFFAFAVLLGRLYG